MTTTRNPLIQDDTVDSLNHISEALASLKDHLTRHAEGEESYPKIAEVFVGMSKNADVIKEAIDFEAERNSLKPTTKKYPHTEKFREWVETIPVEFPPVINMAKGNPAFLNPLIGEDRTETGKNVRQMLEMFKTLALPSYTEKADFSLNEDATWGFFHVLDCMTGALTFEEKYRNNDYEEDYLQAVSLLKDSG